MNKISEKTVEKRLAAYYRSQDCIVLQQAVFSRKRIDIVTKGRGDGDVIAIEVKLHDWRDGLRQATINALACDSSFVAVWHKHATSALGHRDVFEQSGIGLIIVDEQFTPRVEVEPGHPTSSEVVREYFCSSNLKLA